MGAAAGEHAGGHARQCQKADAAIAFVAEFRKGLGQTGLTEGRDVAVEYHWLDGRYEDLPAIISDAVRRHVAVIATPASTPGSLAAKAATSAIPIVFGVGEDPVALGLVASLSQPGANATGINFFASEIDAKRLGLMHELLPKAKRLAVLVNHANPITAEATTRALNGVAAGLGLQLLFFKAAQQLKSMLRLPQSLTRERKRCSSRPMASLPTSTSNWPGSRRVTEYPPAILPRSRWGMAC